MGSIRSSEQPPVADEDITGKRRATRAAPVPIFEQLTPPLHAGNKQIPYGSNSELRISINIHHGPNKITKLHDNTSAHRQSENYDFYLLSIFALLYFFLLELVLDTPCAHVSVSGLSDEHSNYFRNPIAAGDAKMTTNTQPEAGKTQAPATGMRGEIQQKWGKFSTQEIDALKDKDDLVAQVQAKYTLDKAQAQRDVDAFAKGRQL
jgi:hypothetical protein